MAEQTPNTTEQEPQEQQEALIPPRYLLIVAVVAFLVALITGFTQPEFGVVGFGALALSLLSLIAWIFMAPDQARGVMSGRGVRFGGLSIFVTLLLILAMVVVYLLVRGRDWRVDLTERDTFSLTAESEDAIKTYSADPSLPPVRIIGFSGVADAERDQDEVLLQDYQTTSNSKITYEFVDPDRNPGLAAQLGITRAGEFVVAKADANGDPVTTTNDAGETVYEDFQVVTFFSQDELTNAILKVSAEGDFRVYVMNVEGGITTTAGDAGSMNDLVTALTDQLNWKVQTISFLDLQRADTEVTLNDPAADGEVMMIIGGDKPLGDQELTAVTDYLNGGGNLVLFAGSSLLSQDGESLASGDALSQYLLDNFGVRFRDDVVIDPVQYIQSPVLTVATDLDSSHFITSNATAGRPGAIVMDTAESIEVADTLPQNVEVTVLARSSSGSYAESDLEALRNGTIEQTDADLTGPLPVAVVAHNTQTDAKVVLFGSTSMVQDTFTEAQQSGIVNLPMSFSALLWETNYNDFYQRTTITSQQRPQDVPFFADAGTLRMINFITVILLPFGMLALGILVWWNNRERGRASR